MGDTWRRRGHWLLVVDTDPRRADRVAATAPSWPDDAPHVWRDGTGQLALLTWGDQRPGGGGSADPPGVALRGQVRWRGSRWEPPSGWTDALVARRPSAPHGHPMAGLVGDGAAAVVGADGLGAAGADPLGLASLFVAEVGSARVLSTSPDLAAHARAALGAGAAARDPLAGAALARVGYVAGDTTGFVGVARVPVGRWYAISGGTARLVGGPLAWCRDDLAGLTPDELVEVAASALVEGVAATVDAAPEPAVLDLTGGKDSRLLLAVAHAAGVLDRVCIRTVGDPSFPDVATAARVAAALGVAHESGIELRSDRPSVGEQITGFVDATSGLHTAWTSMWVGPGPTDVRLSGTSGEALRSDLWERRVLARSGTFAPGPDAFADWMRASAEHAGGGMLQPAAAAAVDAAVRADLDDLAAGLTDPADLGQAWYLQRHGVIMAGLRLELERDNRVWALVDPLAVAAATRLGATARRSDHIHAALVRRASPAIAVERLSTGEVWEEAAAGLTVPPPPPEQAAAPAPPRFSYLGVAKTTPNDERRVFVHGVFADPVSGIWEVADRAAVRDALDRFDELPMKPRQQLYGLATGAVWLAGG